MFLQRLFYSLITLFGVSVVVFILVRVVPGNPVAMMIPLGASEADILALRAKFGLDEPLIEQYLLWAKAAITSDLGISISLKQDVIGLVLDRLPTTLELSFLAFILASAIGVTFALTSLYWQGYWISDFVDYINSFSLAIPDFIWALVFIFMFGVFFNILPTSGKTDPRVDMQFITGFHLLESIITFNVESLKSLLSHMILPALALALPFAAIITRVLKNSLLEVMAQDYIELAKVKGYSKHAILLKEALPNAMIPTIAITSVQVTFLIGGTVIVERIFAYPGIGNMAIDALINRDLPLIQGLILIFGVLFIIVNLFIDFLYTIFNPRLRT